MPTTRVLLHDRNLTALSAYREALLIDRVEEGEFGITGDLLLTQRSEEIEAFVANGATNGLPFTAVVLEAGDAPAYRGVEALRQAALVDPAVHFVVVANRVDTGLEQILRKAVAPRRLTFLTKPVRPCELRRNLASAVDARTHQEDLATAAGRALRPGTVDIDDLDIPAVRFDHRGFLRAANPAFIDLYPEIAPIVATGAHRGQVCDGLRALHTEQGEPAFDPAGFRVSTLAGGRRVLTHAIDLSDGGELWVHLDLSDPLAPIEARGRGRLLSDLLPHVVRRVPETVRSESGVTSLAGGGARMSDAERRRLILDGRLDERRAPVDLAETLQRVISVLGLSERVETDLRKAGKLKPVVAPAVDIELALTDLLGSAASRAGGGMIQLYLETCWLRGAYENELAALRPGRYVRLRVIVACDVEDVSNMVQLVPFASPDGVAGDGGLAPAYLLAQALGGLLRAVDSGDGELAIEVYLPTTRAETVAPATAEPRPDHREQAWR